MNTPGYDTSSSVDVAGLDPFGAESYCGGCSSLARHFTKASYKAGNAAGLCCILFAGRYLWHNICAQCPRKYWIRRVMVFSPVLEFLLVCPNSFRRDCPVLSLANYYRDSAAMERSD